MQLVFATNTDKAKSELIISYILFELWVHLDRCPTLISCIEFNDESHIIGLGACVAKMIAAQHFNEAKGNEIPCIYGATTSGINWHFLTLERQRLHIDMAVYQITQCDKILGILASMVEEKA